MNMRGRLPNALRLLLCAVGLAALLSLAGCITVGPDYQPPKPELPQQWRLPSHPAVARGEAQVTNWWQVFDDPILTELINLAAQRNLDYQTAVAVALEYRHRLAAAKGEYWPSLDGSASAVNQRSSENTATPSTGATTTAYTLSADAAWEIDLFGGVRRGVESSLATYQSAEEARLDALVSVYASVATAYLQVRTLQTRLAVAQSNIDSQQEVLRLTKARFDNGLATGLDVAQAQTVLASSQAELPPLRQQLAETYNSLSLLLAQPPGAVRSIIGGAAPIPAPPRTVTAGVPADIIRQRPDVRQAERELAASSAEIGVATARLYPSLTLGGTLGLASSNTANLFNAASHFFTIGPTLSWNIFAGGALRSQIKAAEAVFQQKLLAYQLAVLTALHEVDDALTAYTESLRQVRALNNTVKASSKSLKLALSLYKEGLSDFQSVLDAQRSLFSYDDSLAQAQGQTLAYLVQFYKALGGGWSPAQATAQTDQAAARD